MTNVARNLEGSQRAGSAYRRPVFAFATGHYDNYDAEADAYRPAGTNDHLLTYTKAGRGRIGHADGDFVAETGSITLIPPGVLHDYGVLEPSPHWERIWVHFHPPGNWLDLLHLPQIRAGLFHLQLRDDDLKSKVETRFLDMHRLSGLGSAHAERLAMNALEEALLWCDVDNALGSSSVWLDPRVRHGVEFILSDLKRQFSVNRLAKIC